MDKQQQTHDRFHRIQELNSFISCTKDGLNGLMKQFGWTEEATTFKEHEKPLVVCPHNDEHRVGADNLEKHQKKCYWHLRSNLQDSLPLPEAYARFATTVNFDKTLQSDVILQAVAQNPSIKTRDNVKERDVPHTSDLFFSDFTTDERRVLYDYVVSRTAARVPRLSEFILPSGEEDKQEPMSKEQLMAAERDAKRRRVRYRSAKVHTKSKNYSEVIREVINNQMVAYEDWLREECGLNKPSSSTQTQKSMTEHCIMGSKEIIWLDWDYRSNPHVRWKYLLEQEKRRERRKETRERHYDKIRDNEINVLKRTFYDEPRKQYERRSNEYYRKEMNFERSGKTIESSRTHKTACNYDDRSYKHSRKDRAKYEQDHISKYRDYNYKNYKTFKSEARNDKRYIKLQSKVKAEPSEDCNTSAINNASNKNESIQRLNFKEASADTENDDSSEDFSYSSKKQQKRKKKSKSKHKKRHKSKYSRHDISS